MTIDAETREKARPQIPMPAFTQTPWFKTLRLWMPILGGSCAVLNYLESHGWRFIGALHWVVAHYAIVRNVLFGWLPFHVPHEWRDLLVYVLALFFITGTGYTKRTGHNYLRRLIPFLAIILTGLWCGKWGVPNSAATDPLSIVRGYFIALAPSMILIFSMIYWSEPLSRFFSGAEKHYSTFESRIRYAAMCVAGVLVFVAFSKNADERYIFVAVASLIFIMSGGILAWRWVVVATALLLLILGLNYVYLGLTDIA